MSTPHINETTATRSQPKEAVVGELSDDATIDAVTEALEEIGIDPDHIYYLIGQEGADALEDTKGFFSIFDDVIDKPISALRDGKTVVGVFGVDKNQEKNVRQALIDGGVVRTHYFGKWTYS